MHPDVIETSKPSPSQLAGCYGKAAYPTKGAALHWSSMYAKKHWGKGTKPYRCKHCSQWHMGRA